MGLHQFIHHNKATYYLKNYLRYYLNTGQFHPSLAKQLALLEREKNDYLLDRINFYNQLNQPTSLPDSVKTLAEFKRPKKQKTYFFDSYEYTRFFPKNKRMDFTFGDVTHVPAIPSIVKSRPLVKNAQNSVLLKLDKIRHFIYLKDSLPFQKKDNRLVGRMRAHQKERVDFLTQYINHPLFDIGNVKPDLTEKRLCKPFLSKEAHLNYKFILSLEGYDVASNLKWIMSSNSLAVMPKPTCETWFMESRLIPNYHYVLIKDDFSDVEERIEYYCNNPREAEWIAKKANAYVRQFQNKKREDLISLGVIEKYLRMTGQAEGISL